MAVNGVEKFAECIDIWIAGLRDKESRGEIMEAEVIPAAEAMRTAARLIASLGTRVEALERGAPGGGGGEKKRPLMEHRVIQGLAKLDDDKGKFWRWHQKV